MIETGKTVEVYDGTGRFWRRVCLKKHYWKMMRNI